MMDEKRILKPMIRRRGEWSEAGWDEALTFAAQRLAAVARASGADSIAALASPKLTNEELYLLQKFVRVGLKTNNIGSFTNLIDGAERYALDDMFGLTVSTTGMDELEKADVIIVVNADPSEDNLIAELKIKAAVKKGARLVTAASSEIPLVKFSDLWIDSKRGTNTALINGICRSILDKGLEDAAFIEKRTEGYDAFKASVAPFDPALVSEMTGVRKEKLERLHDLVSNREAKIIVVYSIDSLWEKSRNDLQAIGNFMMLSGRAGKPGSGIIILRDFANSQGLLDMGVDPAYLPGYVRPGDTERIAALERLWGTSLRDVFKPVNLKDAMETERIKGLIVFGEDPLSATSNLKLTSGAEFMVVVDSFMTATAMEADVLLPASLPIETEGARTACDRRVQAAAKIFEPGTGMENWQILAALAEKMHIALTPNDVSRIGEEIKKAVPLYGKLGRGRFWGAGLLDESFMTPSGKGRFAALEPDATPYSGEKMCYLFDENYFRLNIKGKLTA
jgi:predicted molibdopterin-dependent oxidoreductase YjgC